MLADFLIKLSSEFLNFEAMERNGGPGQPAQLTEMMGDPSSVMLSVQTNMTIYGKITWHGEWHKVRVGEWPEATTPMGDVVKARPLTRGVPQLLHCEDIQYLIRLIRQNPDYFLDELLHLLLKNRFISVLYATIHRELEWAGVSTKKLKHIACERDENKRADFILCMAQIFWRRSDFWWGFQNWVYMGMALWEIKEGEKGREEPTFCAWQMNLNWSSTHSWQFHH